MIPSPWCEIGARKNRPPAYRTEVLPQCIAQGGIEHAMDLSVLHTRLPVGALPVSSSDAPLAVFVFFAFSLLSFGQFLFR